MTAQDIIRLALKSAGIIGVGQRASQEDMADALAVLNMMLGQWAQKRWLVYRLMDVSFRATGASYYTIGPGGTVDVPRPDRIEAAFVRLNAGPRNDGFVLDQSSLDAALMDPDADLQALPTAQSLDYPLDVLPAREDYNAIAYKGMPGMPNSVFYDTGFPRGTLWFSPVPSSRFEMHLTVKQALTSVDGLDDPVDLPAQYQEAIVANLSVRLAPYYGTSANPVMVALAKASLNTIRASNTQVPRLLMPPGLPGVRRGWGAGLGGFAFAAAAAPAPILPTDPGYLVLDQSSADVGVLAPGVTIYTGATLGQMVLGQAVLGTP